MRESKVERHLVKVVESLGGECPKWVSPNRHGVNDRLVFLPGGEFHMMECKKPGEQLGPHQKRFRARMAELGFTVHKCDSIEWIDDFFEVNKVTLVVGTDALAQAHKKGWLGSYVGKGHPGKG